MRPRTARRVARSGWQGWVLAASAVWSCLAGIPPAAAGLMWEAEVQTGSADKQVLQVAAAEKKFKITQESGSQYLFRLDRGEMYWIDPKRRTYQVMKLSEIERTARGMEEQVRTALAKMKDELDRMPPQQRALVEQMVGKRGAAAGEERVEVRKTGVEKTIAGYRCQEYVVEVAGKEQLRACTTEQITGFESMRDDWWQFQRGAVRGMPILGKAQLEAYRQIPGFPLETQVGATRAVIRKVDRATPPASEFEVPPGYERRPAPTLPDAP